MKMMHMMHMMASLLLAWSLAAPAEAQQRRNQADAWAYVGTESPVGRHPPSYAIRGREVMAPPWSAACMTDHGPSACGEPMWLYGSSDVRAR
jgi:hypothetical protein